MTQSTRDALIASATRLMDEGGLDAVTLREVGRLTGVSHMAPYKHFSSKEELLAAVAAQELQQLRASIAEAGHHHRSSTATLRTVMQGYVAWALAHPARFKLVFGAWTQRSKELDDAVTATRTALVEVVAADQRAGLLPEGDCKRLASLVLALAHGAVDLTLAEPVSPRPAGQTSPEELVDDMFDRLNTDAETVPREQAGPCGDAAGNQATRSASTLGSR
ncbi:TetR/AcrR family transcriptional regulator [Salinactinospora qingdaonensis]|uniref:TetR/AcrR family transcriptional regulator n=1 Tax=Salinactinospora qingdaonensis TaxID=702744 RepID=A0ABP7EWT4_9ACTN